MLTPYQKRQKDEDFMFDDVDERRKRRRKTKTKTKDENVDRKRTEEEKKIFQNKCVSSQNHRNKKRRGRHRSGYTYLPSGETVPAGLVRAERAAILHGDLTLQESPIKYR